ncbi:hypothetical protein [Methanobrevibacter arboriphilus]|uniref:Uncharacterized protein n=1 Tax=Methanobrevibacter arboriphilus TaxID=39441 RepID=A0ACA8R6B4_METAZ|nr:hypothetical protein [Methanobrevibacter arboriphilus]BBL62408.1 hypothetical protein MarbSA_14480 [Methanobrevibacter arboriphilus]
MNQREDMLKTLQNTREYYTKMMSNNNNVEYRRCCESVIKKLDLEINKIVKEDCS